MTRHRVLIARELIDDIARLDVVLKASKKRTAAAVAVSGTSLTDIVGIGPICAAIIIGFTGDITRFPTKGHFATYNATAPIEASSGPNAKHRLNPRGQHRWNVEHGLAGGDELLGDEIAESVGRLDRPLAFLEPLGPLLEPLGLDW